MDWQDQTWKNCAPSFWSNFDSSTESMTFSPRAMSLLNSDTLLRCKVRTTGIRHRDGHVPTFDTDHYFFITNHQYAGRFPFMMGLFCRLVSGLAKSTVDDWSESRWYDAIQVHLDKINILTEPKLSTGLFFPLLPGQPPASLRPNLKAIRNSLSVLPFVCIHCRNHELRDELESVCVQLFDFYDAQLRTQNQVPQDYYGANPNFQTQSTANPYVIQISV